MYRLAIAAILFSSIVRAAVAYSPEELAARTVERRAVEAVIWGIPAVNYDLMLQEMLTKTRGQPNQIVYWSRPLDWHNQTLTPNPDAIYLMAFTDTKDVGPVVIEVPPAEGGSINGNIVNVWQMALEDAGPSGADHGKGGKYLVLPPGYKDKIPDGYIALQSDTFGGYALLRSNLASHSDADIAKSVEYAKRLKVYPLSQAANPPETVFTDAKDVVFDSTIKYDESFFKSLDRVIQYEPWLSRDRAMIDQLRSIGIEKGKTFSPTPAVAKQLEAGVKEGKAWLAEKYESGMVPFYENSRWNFAGSPELVKSAQAGYDEPEAYPVDLRGVAYSYAFVGLKRMGTGQFYLISIQDDKGEAFDGSKTYRLTVPADVPVKQYWSLTAYDRETHALIRNMDRASRSSQIADLKKNADGAVEIFLGPKAPAGKDSNWIPTDPERSFEVMFRLYAPTKALFDKSWVLPDLEQVR
ncbi:DUF1254 domain-containing protein [Rhizobium leguminosarum]|uniref:DUF1254 domain-containing protein n=1 Tax=Rhizobium leguminosarum TaxID=384 RepID=UPI00103C3625|nr:DUF1254 domain-containing protein [Rhizobium leguminosarum]MCA2411469.1 DUF1254 domain-containing protein [Rhizobium leguminosarum]NEI93942.1 DUF1214 domain-containing protein [Rhizobium leguminosarum]TBZ65290.1 DUF1254 domain-containing protein [Rhizobium leguminosarum bv. viciae]TBZ78552.1 DUF1254 domain-containing protein [Rhizobium leguminosarum bv. viciae]TBZ94115.1 DUF1254 domain-containing protein [Rhizobium leguminosarum bv. viciae]